MRLKTDRQMLRLQMYKLNFYEKFDVVIKIILIILAALVITLAGCNTEKRSLEKTQLYLFKHPDFSAGYCAEQYPVKDSVIVKYDTVLDLGEYVDVVPSDTVRKDSFIYITNTVTKTKTVTKTIYKDSIIIRRDYAREKELQLALSDCEVNNNTLLENYNKQVALVATWQGRAKKRFWLIFALIGGAVVYTGMRIKKYFV